MRIGKGWLFYYRQRYLSRVTLIVFSIRLKFLKKKIGDLVRCKNITIIIKLRFSFSAFVMKISGILALKIRVVRI